MNAPADVPCPYCGAPSRISWRSGLPVYCELCSSEPGRAIHLRANGIVITALCGSGGSPVLTSLSERVTCVMCCRMEGW